MTFSRSDLLDVLKEYPKTFVVVGAHSLDDYFKFEDQSIDPNFFLFEADKTRVESMEIASQSLHKVQVFHACLSDLDNQLLNFYSLPLGSSSILSPKHENLAHLSEKFLLRAQVTQVTSSTLDSWIEKINLERPLCLIIDVQGAEGKVLAGADRFLRMVDVMLIEASTKEYYENQILFPQLKSLLSQHNFMIVRRRIDPLNYQGDLMAINKEGAAATRKFWALTIGRLEDYVWVIHQSSMKKFQKWACSSIKLRRK